MKKIFTFAAAVLASFSLLAQDPTLPTDATPSVTLDATVADANLYAITNEVHNGKTYIVYDLDTIRTKMKAGKVEWIKGPKNDGGNSASISFASDDAEVNFGFNSAWTRAWGINNARYAGIRVKNCSEFAALTKSNSTKDGKTLYIHVFKQNGEAWDFIETLGTDIYNKDKYYVLSATLDAAAEYVILLTSGNSSNCLTAQIRFTSVYCQDPEFTVPASGTGFVGDPIDLAITSNNKSKPINSAITLDGKEAVMGTDYSYSVSLGLVQATPLKAGTFVITFSQASDGTYCAAEESATFEISEKTPVTSFKVEGPTKAHIGEEVTLTATDFNATPTEISWLQLDIYDIVGDKESYTFTSNVAGTIEFYALARNNFNNPDDQADDYQAAVYHAVTFAVGTDATLSDLKVNGATVAGFDATVFEYNLGNIGVYEALNVEATAADAPYASAAVVDDKAGKVTITVTAQDESTKEYVINYTRAAATELVAVSDSTTWDWAKAGDKTAQLDDKSLPTKTQEFNFADVLINQDASFKAASLAAIGQYANGGGYAQLNLLKFHAAKAGTIVVEFSNTGSSDRPDRVLLVNDAQTEFKSNTSKSHVTTDKIAIEAGDVILEGLEMKAEADGGPVKNMLRFYVLTYVPNGEPTAIENTEAAIKAVKVVRDGQMMILKNGVLYNMQGAVVK